MYKLCLIMNFRASSGMNQWWNCFYVVGSICYALYGNFGEIAVLLVLRVCFCNWSD